MPTLQAEIQSLANQFAAGVLHAIRASSLEEILGGSAAPGKRGPGRPPSKRGPGRPPGKRGPGRPPGPTSRRLRRRSAKDLSGVADTIVALVAKHKGGLRAEQIRAELAIPKNAWAKPLGLALSSKKLSKKGNKRATTYFAR